MTASDGAAPLTRMQRLAYAALICLCVMGISLLLLLPSESLITDLVYRAF
jgi:hypothetical protein